MVQRQVEEEEEDLEKKEIIQQKPLSEQITPLVQRQAPDILRIQRQEEPEEEEGPIQTKRMPGHSSEVTPEIASNISDLQGSGGQPLPKSVRDFFEPRFGYDFSHVRVHTNLRAADIAKAVNARAFTTGQDVTFGAGQYAQEKSNGRRLMAHELVHVIQQSNNTSLCKIQRKIGFEFEMSYTMKKIDPSEKPADWLEPDEKLVKEKSNHFDITRGRSRMEVTTDPFEESSQGRKELVKSLDNIVELAKSLEQKCREVRKEGRGYPWWFKPPAQFIWNVDRQTHAIHTLRQRCSLGASPQATVGIRLGKFGDLVNKIKKSEKSKLALTGKRRYTKEGKTKTRRLGLTSVILFEAQKNVAKSARLARKNWQRLLQIVPEITGLKKSDFSKQLENFMVLLVSYLRTSVRLDPRDKESYYKAYPPIVSHTRFIDIFHRVLNEKERKIFINIYGKSSRNHNLFELAAYKGKGNGSTELFPKKLSSGITWKDWLSKIINDEPISSLDPSMLVTPKATKYGPEEVGPLTTGSRPMGIVVELRRLGFEWRHFSIWKELALHIYDMVSSLNR